jgi:hypothetical protein
MTRLPLLNLLHPALFGFAALTVLPLVIHLLNRRRYRTVPWAAMEFLLTAYKKKRKRLQLENLLLLLLRCAIPVVLALAFARPFFGASSLLSGLAESTRTVVVVLDESYSMSRRAGTGTQFGAALEQIRRLEAGLDFERGDRMTLVTLAKEPRVLCVEAGRDDFERKLASLPRPTWESADLARTLDLLLDEVLKQIPAEPEVWLLSDFQKSTFDDSGRVGDSAAGASTGRMQRLAQQSRVHLVNLSEGTLPPDNLAVVDLRASEPLAIAGQAVRLTATITRTGHQPSGSGHFRIGDVDRPVNFVFDAEGKATAEIYHSVKDPGDVGVEFRLDEDELPDDDARFFRLPVKSSLPVLLVDGKPSGGDTLTGAAGNVLLILDPLFGASSTDAVTTRRWFEPTVIADYELSKSKPDFSKYDAVVFVNVREIEAEHVLPELESYVESGGGALFFLGDQVVPQSYDEHLFKGDGSGLMPLRLGSKVVGEPLDPVSGDLARRTDFFRLEIADELHPAVRTFADDRRRPMLKVPVFCYWPFEVDGVLPASARVVLQYQGSHSPALIDHRVGRGRTLWFNVSGAEDDWSNLTRASATFFPLVWDMLNHLCVRDPGEHDLPIGGAIARSFSALPTSWTFTQPGGTTKTLRTPPPPQKGLYRLPPFSDTQVPGLYALDVQFGGDEPPSHELFAVNVDPRESDLTFLDLEQERSLYAHVNVASFDREVATDVQQQRPERQGEIWKKLVMALLAMVLLETLLAWRFGRFTT